MIGTSEIAAVFSYEPDTGAITRDGKPSGTKARNGYIQLCYKKKFLMGHRVAWLLMTGSWPQHEIDHINRNRSDNRWCNLREATRSQNAQNQMTRSTSKSGFKGVSFHTQKGKWRATIFADRHIHIGYFDTPIEASMAYQLEARRLFGDFSPI